MTRTLKTATLDKAAGIWAGHFLLPSRFSKNNPEVAIAGREWALQNFYNADFKDEFAHLLAKFKRQLGPDALADFEAEAKDRFTPRDDKVFADLLAEKLAIDPNGVHLPGKIGTVILGSQPVGRRITRHGIKPARWNVYAGESEERALGHLREIGKAGPGADPLPPADTLWSNETDHLGAPSELMALNTNVSVAFAIAGLDAARVLLDEGSLGAVIQCRDGTQPVDPNAALTGANLATLTCSAVAFGAAGDAAPGALATAAAITDDSSADATGSVTHCRASSSSVADTPLNDHIDGSAGLTAGTFDFEFNTDAFVSGAVISITAWTATQPQGPTAT